MSEENQEQQNDEQIKAVYGEAEIDISLPDIPRDLRQVGRPKS